MTLSTSKAVLHEIPCFNNKVKGMDPSLDVQVQSKFHVLKTIGRGAYGQVHLVIKKHRNQKISSKKMALKKNFDCFQNTTDSQRCYREVKYLQLLQGHENIIKLEEVFPSLNRKDLYMLFEYVPADLHAVLRNNTKMTKLHHQFIIYQILKGIKYIHSAGLVHRDIKPSNVLVDQHCKVKLCDFGLTRHIEEIEGRHLTDYVCTRFYRPPEVLLVSSKYDYGIDIWAVACILGEMICKRPLFPGTSSIDQLEKILQLDTSEDLTSQFQHLELNEIGLYMLRHVKRSKKKTIAEMLYGTRAERKIRMGNLDVIEFLEELLQFDTNKRYSATEALSHRFLSEFHDPKQEKEFEGSVSGLDDNRKYAVDEYLRAVCLV